MTETEKRALIEAFLSDELSLDEIKAFKTSLEEDSALRQLFAQELELIKSLDPEGDYQRFKESLEKVNRELFGGEETRNLD